MQIHASTLTLTGAEPKGENPIPYFRDREHDRHPINAGLLPDELDGLGRETRFRVLPYNMQENYDRRRRRVRLNTVVAENRHLRAVFLSGYGGRLWSLYDKDEKRELLFSNEVLRPANLAIRDAWLAGGIEWNLGQLGHWCLTCEPVYFAVCADKNGEKFLRMYEYERQKRQFLQVDFHLPDGSRCLFAHVKIASSAPEPSPLYWWTNIAVPEENGMRVCSGSDGVVYLRPESLLSGEHAFSHAEMPFLPAVKDCDVSYPHLIPYSCEYFFQNPPEPRHTWETAAYSDGRTIWERSTPSLRYRKMFCWGAGRGGRHWKDYLSLRGNGDYLEIQAGLSPTQMHSTMMPASGCLRFTQAFGGMTVDPAHAFGDWDASKSYMGGCVELALPAELLGEYDSKFTAAEEAEPVEWLSYGSGWGALEAEREPGCVPKGLVFPETTVGAREKPWLELLRTGRLPDVPPDEITSWMTDPRWLALLQSSLENPKNSSAAALLHLGVMLAENGDYEQAKEAFSASDAARPSALACVCLSELAEQEGNLAEACELISRAVARAGQGNLAVMSEEFIRIHTLAGRYDDAWRLFSELPEELRSSERLRLASAIAAFHTENLDFLRGQFRYEFSCVREGEAGMLEPWFLMRASQEAEQTGEEFETALERVRKTVTPPRCLDFRQVTPNICESYMNAGGR